MATRHLLLGRSFLFQHRRQQLPSTYRYSIASRASFSSPSSFSIGNNNLHSEPPISIPRNSTQIRYNSTYNGNGNHQRHPSRASSSARMILHTMRGDVYTSIDAHADANATATADRSQKRQQHASAQGRARTTKPSSLKRLLVASFPYYYYYCYYYYYSATTTTIPVEGFVPCKSNPFHSNFRNVQRSGFGGFVPPGKQRWFSTGTDDAGIHTKADAEADADVPESTGEDHGSDSNSDSGSDFATSYHAPVMVHECLDALLDCERGRIRNPKPRASHKKKKKKQSRKPRRNQQSSQSQIEPETQTLTQTEPETSTTTTPVAAETNAETKANDQEPTGDHPPLVFVDGTLGGGGHSDALLRKLRPGDILFGCDVDPDALSTASERLSEYTDHDGTNKPLFVPVRTNFGDLADTLPTIVHPVTGEPILGGNNNNDNTIGVDGILLDLGVSSHQIDEPGRGFSFMRDGPLDMRMTGSSGGLTAADVCNEFDEAELQRILSVYGDEPRAKTIARAIAHHRPLSTTSELVAAIASVTPRFARNKRHGQTATCARVFQSLRIVVNNEDGVLSRVLSEACPALLRPGGRLVVMSYHSMEDRATKRIMRDGTLSRSRSVVEKDIYGNELGPTKPFRPVQKQRRATEEETARNPRARSAVLRVAERQAGF